MRSKKVILHGLDWMNNLSILTLKFDRHWQDLSPTINGIDKWGFTHGWTRNVLAKQIAHRFQGRYLQLFQCLIQFVGGKKFTEINTVTYERMSEINLFLEILPLRSPHLHCLCLLRLFLGPSAKPPVEKNQYPLM